MERGRRDDLRSGQCGETVEFFDLKAKLLREKTAEPRQLRGVAQCNDPPDLRRPIEIRKVADRALQLGQQVVEHGLHGLEHGLGVRGRRGVALQMLGLGERELQLLGQRFGEVAAAERNRPLPNAKTVADDQVRRVGPYRDDDNRLGGILGVVIFSRRKFAQLIEA